MKSEEVMKTIRSAGLKVLNEHEFCELNHANHFNRELFFMVDEKEYCIEWFCNLMKLRAPCGIEVNFTRFEHSGTWPNHFKRNLQFYYGDNCVAIIGVEKYPEQGRANV